MNILVTGGAGFIGSHLVHRLAAQGCRVTILDNFNRFYNPGLKRKNLETLPAGAEVSIREIDLLDWERLIGLFKAEDFEQVVHLAAWAGVTPSVKLPLLYEEVNIRGTLNLLDLCREHGIQNFTFASSSSVYGGNTKIPFSETDPVDRPICPYAMTKRAGELLCYTYAHLYKMNIPCLRFFTVYGPRQRPEMAIVKFIRHIDRGLELVLYGDGRYERDYTYIDDIIDGILAAMQRRQGFEIFNLGGHRTTSVIDLVRLIEARMGKSGKVTLKPKRSGEVDVTYADISHSKAVLGYEPHTSLEQGIDRTVEWYQGLDVAWE